ncbi:MAG: NAD(P)-dependent oxidoreductase [Actinomycetota bacterium]|jgi:3-hydroxyisobutyrate dehydrogenase|nr:NAD(P)-dependent oxidoreductase [Rubrobacteraceae bacterium]MBA3614587.1 NAD(P)-dependent oxidoreductase [Rubrobacteraceae bacterium]MBA3702551.1 NAD(P)-dependent oxidoreductase [Rubrobacteraceae bacterium]MDQ3182083.1 NAD(P)-dependent oxidoreductase [Actinomycetota bacterium]MDQ3497494.1 NAD(P)-dependent oxidoreductase [Actinomycetota bacterium]
MADDKTVAVLGTGIMGAAMARNLLSAGMEVRAWNRSREKAEPLAQEGAEVADNPADAAKGADFILTMLSDADAVEEAVGGDVLSALAEDSVWLQMSTVGEGGNERLLRLASDHDVAYVDAPVLGTRQPAEQGQLIVLASGPKEVRERSEQVFGAFAGKTVWLGEAGEGSRLKLVVNNWIVGLLGVLAETVAFAEATGVDPAKFLETIEGGPLGLPYAQMKGSMMVEDDFPTSFSANLARKDAALVLDSARDHDLHLRIAEAVTARFDEAIQAGHGEEDMAAVYKAARPDRG